MVSTREILQKQKTAVSTAEEVITNTAVTAVSSKSDFNKRIDSAIDDFKHLTGGTADRMSGWYAGRIRQIGIEQFIRLAKTAEQEGKNPARYFSWLLKNAN